MYRHDYIILICVVVLIGTFVVVDVFACVVGVRSHRNRLINIYIYRERGRYTCITYTCTYKYWLFMCLFIELCSNYFLGRCVYIPECMHACRHACIHTYMYQRTGSMCMPAYVQNISRTPWSRRRVAARPWLPSAQPVSRHGARVISVEGFRVLGFRGLGSRF